MSQPDDDDRDRWTWSAASDQLVRDRRDAATKKADQSDAGCVLLVAIILTVIVVLL